MHCCLLRVTQFVVLCWTGRILRGQQMTDSNNDQGTSYFYYQQPEHPRDCAEIQNQCSSGISSGVYLIRPDGFPDPFEIYCNNTNSEGWTVILRRDNGFVGFDRNWNEYKDGFGFLSQDFWIGHEKLSFVTNQKNYKLRIDITNSNGLSCYLNYEVFRTSDEFGNFKVTSLEQYSGNADECISFCSSNMIPGDCNCQKTCSNPSVCVNTCSTDDTCVCPNGFYLKGEECVPLSQCTSGCFVDGEIVPEGGSYVNADCSRRGVCNNGQLTWNDAYSCNSNEVCEVRNNVRQCYSDDVMDCLDIYNAGFSDSDVYTISPANWSGSPFQVYCNMTDGGGWTVFQRRVDGTVNFYRNWTSYKEGFGTPYHENWLGNDKLYHLTNQKRYTLRIDFVNLDGSPYYAKSFLPFE
ncbi:Fibrinogen C domain-containing protein 1 [Holothuria leucospilota]|uniref:Fibrinogen C domain-containing protein 1 n=1 Tax=Holothuria leucospilota TaxID=206669 RepID=A0A9Q1BVM5_HOLLE|nr:Fibrinogen C domain-containing protein 1 [Holothuria leucospilota]